MKRDILKKFVDENRDDFDDQSPDADILGKLQSRLNLQPMMATPQKAKVLKFRNWWAAAAVITIVIGIGLLLQQNTVTGPTLANTERNQIQRSHTPTDKADATSAPPPAEVAIAARQPMPELAVAQAKKPASQKVIKGTVPAMNTAAPAADNWQNGLQNESSSVRLAAVLASEKNKTLSNDDIRTLYFTMNNDANSNVRLAALEVLKKREQSNQLILQSVDKQDDPVVQMELLASLSPADAVKVEQQLLEITQNPLTIDAVRNEAYAVLLRSNTNF